MKKKTVVLFLFFTFLPFFLTNPYIRSRIVMTVYSRIMERDSLNGEGIKISLKNGFEQDDGWYPKVLTFNDDEGFSRFLGEDARLTVLYNFPAFDNRGIRSDLFDEKSPYYSSFYGAYLVRTKDPFGLKDGKMDPMDVIKVPEYDLFRLVLRDFGIKREDEVFSFSLKDIIGDQSISGISGWTRMEGTLTVNGCAHKRSSALSYLQYGLPDRECSSPFEPADLSGIIYGRYFSEADVSVFLYAITNGEELLNRCDKELLREAHIDFD